MRFGGVVDISFVDIPNQIATVLFLAGCSFKCDYCFNADLVSPQSGIELEPDVIAEKIYNGFSDACCISGGEPTMQQDLPILLEALRKVGFKYLNLNTNGSNPEMLKKCLSLLDSVYIDIKTAPYRYDVISGADGAWKNVEKSLALMISSKVKMWPRTTYAYPIITATDIISISRVLHNLNFRGKYVIQDCFPKFSRNKIEYQKIDEGCLEFLREEVPEGIDLEFNFRHPNSPSKR